MIFEQNQALLREFLFNGVDELGTKTFIDYFPEYQTDGGTVSDKRSIIGKSFETRPWDSNGRFIGWTSPLAELNPCFYASKKFDFSLWNQEVINTRWKWAWGSKEQHKESLRSLRYIILRHLLRVIALSYQHWFSVVINITCCKHSC